MTSISSTSGRSSSLPSTPYNRAISPQIAGAATSIRIFWAIGERPSSLDSAASGSTWPSGMRAVASVSAAFARASRRSACWTSSRARPDASPRMPVTSPRNGSGLSFGNASRPLSQLCSIANTTCAVIWVP
jgi:hypothetical protein